MPSLPQSLLEEINAASHHARRKKPHKLSRKDSRKQARSDAKSRKAEYFANTRQPLKRPSEENADGPVQKKIKVEQPANKTRSVPAKIPPSQTELDEDAYIAYLESKLGYPKGKHSRADDGLDDLLDFTSSLNFSGGLESVSSASESESESLQDSTEEEWQGIVQEEESEDDESDESPQELAEEPVKATRYLPPQQRNNADSEALAKLSRQLKGLLNRMSEQNIATILDSVEDAYRNNRRNDVTTTLTNLIVTTIASHSSLLDSYVVLHAAFVSSLYKIIGVDFAAHFVERVVESYEGHYSDLHDQAQGSSATNDTEERPSGKETANLLVLLSELYNFQVVSCVLIYDVVRVILEKIPDEINVELLLKVIRNSGHQLRTDDPLALKHIIQIVHDKIGDRNVSELSSRTRFMLETLTNLKNNKVSKRNAAQIQAGGDAVERMKKFIVALGKKRSVVAHEPLRVSLQDLHSADTKGKWWLVGAAWGGDPLVDRRETGPAAAQVDSDNALLKLARKQGMNTDIRRSIFVVLMSSDDYVDACERLSQLNLTEIQQREIVRVLLHCCGNEKVYNPYYTLVAQHLCRSSHSFKITLQFCLWDFLRDLGESNVGGVEVIRNIGESGIEHKEMTSARVTSVAKAYAWWIAKDSVTLGVLKPLDFTILKPKTREFLKELFVQIYSNTQVVSPVLSTEMARIPASQSWKRTSVEEIFVKAAKFPDLSMGLAYILVELFKNDGEDELGKFIRWANEVAVDTLRSGVDIL